MRDFYGTGFGPVGITGKKIGPIMSNFLGQFFHVFMAKKIGLIFLKKYPNVRTEKLHKKKVRKAPKISLKFIYKL